MLMRRDLLSGGGAAAATFFGHIVHTASDQRS